MSLLLKSRWIFTVLIFLIIIPTRAQITWLGSGSGLWSEGANWSGGIVPGEGDAVLFDGTGLGDCRLDEPVRVQSLTMTLGYTGTLNLECGGVLHVEGDLTQTGGGAIDAEHGDLYVGGTMSVENYGSGTGTLGNELPSLTITFLGGVSQDYEFNNLTNTQLGNTSNTSSFEVEIPSQGYSEYRVQDVVWANQFYYLNVLINTDGKVARVDEVYAATNLRQPLSTAYYSVSGTAITFESEVVDLLTWQQANGFTNTDNTDFNWTATKVYGENGELVGESKTYTDKLGRLKQSLSRDMATGQVVASEPIYDKYGRTTIAPMAAPTLSNTMAYKPNFITNTNGEPYSDSDYNHEDRHASTFNAGGQYNNYIVNLTGIEKVKIIYQTPNPDPNAIPNVVFEGTIEELDASDQDFIYEGSPYSYELSASHPFTYDIDINGNLTNYSSTLTTVGNINDPNPIGDQEPGTLGWYYSDNNYLEPFTDATDYPYSRTYSNDDIIGGVTVSAAPGNELRMGKGREVQSITIPQLTALDHYVQVLKANYQPNATITTFSGIGSKSIAIDANGKEVVAFADKEGKTLASCMSGYNDPNYPAFQIQSDITEDWIKTLDIHIPANIDPQLTIAGSDEITIQNLRTGQIIFEGPAGNAPSTPQAGFYRIKNEMGMHNSNVTYQVNYSHFTYTFYNEGGQHIATTMPNGITDRTSTNLPFTNTYKKTGAGQLKEQAEPDAGITQMVYRKDGALRFGQDAQQKLDNQISYINYDKENRVTESGIYTGTNITFQSQDEYHTNPQTNSVHNYTEYDDQSILIQANKEDVVKNRYDKKDPNCPSPTAQRFTRGRISSTSNDHRTTYYSYDMYGQVEWVIMEINNLGPKRVDYSYDYFGNLTEVAYQKNTIEAFHHHYTYDADQRLIKVETSTDQVTKTTQAEYVYYIHGGLKKKILADGLQGVDYVYTINGQLKAINHNDFPNDPGQDAAYTNCHSQISSPDAFGMTLEYYPGDYNRQNTNIKSLYTTQTPDYSGNITAAIWDTKVDDEGLGNGNDYDGVPSAYQYSYDQRNQLKQADFGRQDHQTNNLPAITTNNKFQLSNLNYDNNGNIKSLQRRDNTGTITDDFQYNYQDQTTNKLTSVYNLATSQDYAQYTYNAIGQLTAEVNPQEGTAKYVSYNSSGLTEAVYSDPTKTTKEVSFNYDEGGKRQSKSNYDATGNPTQTTYYVTDPNGTLLSTYQVDHITSQTKRQEIPIYGTGRIGTVHQAETSPVYAYELTDHLGNMRALIAKDGTTGDAMMMSYKDYYPFGSIHDNHWNDGIAHRHDYQGQYAEKDEETGWNAFELRMYDSKIGRWTSVDPYREFSSPYIGMGNIPTSAVDPDGGCITCEDVTGGAAQLDESTIVSNSGGSWGRNNSGGDLNYDLGFMHPGDFNEVQSTIGERLLFTLASRGYTNDPINKAGIDYGPKSYHGVINQFKASKKLHGNHGTCWACTSSWYDDLYTSENGESPLDLVGSAGVHKNYALAASFSLKRYPEGARGFGAGGVLIAEKLATPVSDSEVRGGGLEPGAALQVWFDYSGEISMKIHNNESLGDGHSVVFAEYMFHKGKPVGIYFWDYKKYRLMLIQSNWTFMGANLN